MSKFTTLLLLIDPIYKIALEEEHKTKFDYLAKKLAVDLLQAESAQEYREEFEPKNESMVKDHLISDTYEEAKALLLLQKAHEEKRWQRESIEMSMKNLRVIIESEGAHPTASLGALRSTQPNNDATKEQEEYNRILHLFNILREIHNEELHTTEDKPVTKATFENFFKERGL